MFAKALTARLRFAAALAWPFRIIAFLILVTAAFTIPNEADATFSDQAELDSRDLSEILMPGFQRYGVITGCAVSAQGTPNMTVAVASGTCFVANNAVPVAATNLTIGAATGNPRFDLIVVDSRGNPVVVAGTAAANPVFPTAGGRTVLASVYVPTSTTSIDSTRIVDKRVMLVLSTEGMINAADYGAVPDDFYSDAVVPTAPGTKATVATQGILSGTGTGTFTISSGTSYPTTSFNMAIDSEVMTGSISGTTVTITARGVSGTTAATHAVGASVYEAITSATANFVSTDVGANIVFLRTGDANFLDQDTTIRSVLSTTAITVNNRSTRSAAVYSSIRFYVSRYGDQAAAIQAAINACSTAGGGFVLCPGVGYVHNAEFVLKNRVVLRGVGVGGTRFHLASGLTAVPCVRNDTTSNNTAMLVGIRDCTLDNNRDRQTALTVTTTIAAGTSYTSGGVSTFIDVTSAANLFSGGGVIQIGTNKITYQDITFGGGSGGTDRLLTVTGGQEATTDANASAGATVTQIKAVGVYRGSNPYNATPTIAEEYDAHFLIRDVRIKYAGGDGIQDWGQSESRIENVWVEQCQEIGFRASFDSWMINCTADGVGRYGYLIRGSSCQGTNLKAFFCGWNVSADGYGFLFEGYTGLEAGCKTFTNCNAQDNKAGGFRIRNCQRVMVSGSADSNSQSSAGTYPALTMEGSGTAGTNGCVVQLACTDRNSVTTQRNAIKINDAGVANNQFILTHGNGTDSPTNPVETAIAPGSILTSFNHISINGGTAEIFGDSSDGNVTFDGTTTILGMAPSSSVYTMTRDIYVGCMTVNTGVTVRTAGFRIFANGFVRTVGTGVIHNDGTNGAAAPGTGAAGGLTGYYLGGTAGGAGGSNAVGVAATNGSANTNFGGAGGAGSTATNAGGAGGTVSAPTAAMGGLQSIKSYPIALLGALRTATAVPTWTGMAGGAGGGGGGSTGTTAKGGEGGGGGGVVGIFAREVYASSTGRISANGGNGFNGTAGNGTGGGGGGGGGGLVMIFTHFFSGAAATASAGARGTGGTTGAASAAGIVQVMNV